MAMIDASRFLAQCRTNAEFRKRLYGGGLTPSGEPTGFKDAIAAAGYDFSDAELEDALRGLQLRARDEYEADEIKELGQWYSFMRETDGPESADAPRAPTACSPSACASCALCR